MLKKKKKKMLKIYFYSNVQYEQWGFIWGFT